MTVSRTTALALIVGDQYRDDEVRRMLESVGPHVSGIFISYNGTKKAPFSKWKRWTDVPIVHEFRAWDDDFAAARNHSFGMVPDTFDWVLWMDTDDVLVAPDGLDPVYDSLDEYTKGVFLRYDYAIEPKTRNVVVQQWRERIMSNSWPFEWRWPIHESCHGPMGTQFARREEVWIEHLRTSGEDRGARERNRRIIARARREHPDEPRFIYYMANETMAEAAAAEPGIERDTLCDAAILEYRNFLKRKAGEQTDDVYAAAVRIGDLQNMKEENNEAVDSYLQAIKLYPNWPDAYVGIAKVMMELGDFGRMKEFADMATRYSTPVTSAAIEPMSSTFHPLFLRAIAKEELGDLKGALDDYRLAKEKWNPPEGQLEQKIMEISRRMMTTEVEQEDVRRKLRGTRPEKSICFYTNPIAEDWNWRTLAEGGHGGAETMILELAPRFAADGWRVVVFGGPGDQHGLNDNGVEMYRQDEWLASERFEVFVSSRAAEPFSSPINARKKMLWLHDVNNGPKMIDAIKVPDVVVPLTRWHANHVQQLYGVDDDRIAIIPNGIDMSLFPERDDQTGRASFIYASSPDRGLEELLGMWPLIRQKHEDATLEIFYGWEFIDKLLAMGFSTLYLGPLKNRINRAVEMLGGEQGGIYWRDRVPPDVLAEGFLRSEIWGYPTQFMETFCLTAVQAQAAGVLPITSQLAALNETVSCPWYTLSGWPRNADYQTRFLRMIDKALDPRYAGMREQAIAMGRKHAQRFTIDAAYARWNELIREMG